MGQLCAALSFLYLRIRLIFWGLFSFKSTSTEKKKTHQNHLPVPPVKGKLSLPGYSGGGRNEDIQTKKPGVIITPLQEHRGKGEREMEQQQ